MSNRKWETNFDGTKILVKQMNKTMRLYINHRCVDTNAEMILGAAPQQILSGSFAENDQRHNVEVIAKSGWLRLLVQISVDGNSIAGDF